MTGQDFRDLFDRMVFTDEQQKRADQQNRYLDHLRRCKWDHDYNCDHYDPLAKLSSEEREKL